MGAQVLHQRPRLLPSFCSAAGSFHPQGQHMVQEGSWTSSHYGSTGGRRKRQRGRARRSKSGPLRRSSWNAHNSLPLGCHWPQLGHVLTPSRKGRTGNVTFNWACCCLNKTCLLFIRKKKGRNSGWQRGVSVADAYVQRTVCIIAHQGNHGAGVLM